MNPTIYILMTAGASLLLGAVVLVVLLQGVLAVLLYREAKQLDGVRQHQEKLASLSANVAALHKQHTSLDELVSSYMNRQATRQRRNMKKTDEEESETSETPSGLEFPSLFKREN
jgi:biopolymer transport protein ExbB/TolQ